MSWNSDLAVKAAQECARNVEQHKSECKWELKPDCSLVTQLDKSNEKILRSILLQNNDYFLGEESIDTVNGEYMKNALNGCTYIVDPIDGTAPFAHGLPLWAISIGYMEKGFLTDGCIMLPEIGEAYVSRDNDVLFTHDIYAPLDKWMPLQRPGDEWSVGSLMIIGQSFSKQHLLPFKNPVIVPGSAVYAFSTLLSGKSSGYIGHMKLWDVAGSLPLLRRLGFACNLLNGIAFDGDVQNGAFCLDTASPKCWAFTADMITAQPRINTILQSVAATI